MKKENELYNQKFYEPIKRFKCIIKNNDIYL